MSWQSQRTMTPAQYVWTLKRLGMSHLAAGRFLGMSGRTSRRYVTGEAAIPVAQVLLLRVMLEYNEKPQVPPWKKGQN